MDQIFVWLNSPVGIGMCVGLLTLTYMLLMSINLYLPPILLLSFLVGYIVYYIQKKCGNCSGHIMQDLHNQLMSPEPTAPPPQELPQEPDEEGVVRPSSLTETFY